MKLRENKAIHNSPSTDGRDQSSPREIADDAGLSLPAVKKHVHLIFRKLEVTRRTQLIALMRSGIMRRLLRLRSALMTVHAIDLAKQFTASARRRDCWRLPRRLICSLFSPRARRRVFGTADHSEADRTLDRAGAAQE